MPKVFVLFCFATTLGSNAFSQQLAFNEGGIVNTYDAAGNRMQRRYCCNNGSESYPQKIRQEETRELLEVQPIDDLYPNPTTGRFFITFSKVLNGARISLTDANGKMVQQFKANGNKIDFDLSSVAAGVYLVKIEENGTVITKKVIKQ